MTAPHRVLLLGATGYTGRLTAREMVRHGVAPILLGRNVDQLRELVALSCEETGE